MEIIFANPIRKRATTCGTRQQQADRPTAFHVVVAPRFTIQRGSAQTAAPARLEVADLKVVFNALPVIEHELLTLSCEGVTFCRCQENNTTQRSKSRQ